MWYSRNGNTYSQKVNTMFNYCDECGATCEDGVPCGQCGGNRCPFEPLQEEGEGLASLSHTTYEDLLESMPSDEDFEGHEAAIPSTY